MSLTRDDIEINMLRLHDRFDALERKLDQVLGKKLHKGEKFYLDNSDMMEITGLSYSALRYYRNKNLLFPVTTNGRNRYPITEAIRFMEETLHIKLDHYVEFQDIQHIKKAKEKAVKTTSTKDINTAMKSTLRQKQSQMNGARYIPNPSVDNSKRMPKGFAIICYKNSNICISDYHNTIYERYYGTGHNGEDDPRNAIISKEEAEFVIEKLNLTLYRDNEHGKVWE